MNEKSIKTLLVLLISIFISSCQEIDSTDVAEALTQRDQITGEIPSSKRLEPLSGFLIEKNIKKVSEGARPFFDYSDHLISIRYIGNEGFQVGSMIVRDENNPEGSMTVGYINTDFGIALLLFDDEANIVIDQRYFPSPSGELKMHTGLILLNGEPNWDCFTIYSSTNEGTLIDVIAVLKADTKRNLFTDVKKNIIEIIFDV